MSTQSNESTQARPTAEQMAAKHMRNDVAARLRRFHEALDLMEIEAKRNLVRAEGGSGTYAAIAADFAHSLETAVMNVHLGTLISTAADADIAHAKGE